MVARAVESSQFEGNFTTSPAPMGTLSLWPSTLPVIRIFSVFADQLENALVRDTTADAVHQDVVIDRVEELPRSRSTRGGILFMMSSNAFRTAWCAEQPGLNP